MTDVAILINESGVVQINVAGIEDTEFIRQIHPAIERFDAAVRRLQKASMNVKNPAPTRQ
jgi:hypothetical protein